MSATGNEVQESQEAGGRITGITGITRETGGSEKAR